MNAVQGSTFENIYLHYPLTRIYLFIAEAEASIDKISIVKMATAYKRGGLRTRLTHGTSTFDSHRPEQVTLTALAAGYQPVWAKNTARPTLRQRQ